MIVTNPTVDSKTNPVIDTTTPRFGWHLSDDNIGARQSAYQIRVAQDAAQLKDGGALLYDTGKVDSDQSQHVTYAGPALVSRQGYHWQVRVWDGQGQPSEWSAPATFEMALLARSDWSASWISPPGQGPAANTTRPMIFRKGFAAKGEIVRARVYSTARGVYALTLNGARVGDDFFAPGWTSYRHRIQYQAYDVTALLRSGDNVLGATLTDGWFRGPLFADNRRNMFGPRSSFIAQLEIEYADGTIDRVVTDGSWTCSVGSLQLAEIQHGETWDFREEPKGWMEPGFAAEGWLTPDELTPTTAELVFQSGCPLRQIQTIRPISINHLDNGLSIVDFGQNMVGWVRIRLKGDAGTTVTLRHAEVLNLDDGTLFTENLRSARQTCIYTLADSAEKMCEPQFSWQGFRYVSIEGFPGTVTLEDMEGVVIHSDMAQTGRFETSDTMLNQLQSNILWGQKGNFMDVPLDCPQRDERLGWTGDAQVFAPTAMFNMDVSEFFRKWLADVAVEQDASGSVPWVIPSINFGGSGACGWSDASTLIPMMLYRHYGDLEQLAGHYPMMRKWVAYMEERAGADHLWTGDFQFGDWLDFFSATRGTDHGLTSEDLVATAFYARSTALLAEASELLGETSTAANYARLFKRIAAAFQERWVSAEGVIAEDTQTAYVLALSFDLLDQNLRDKAAARLAADIRHRGHLTTGFLGTPLLLDVLTRYGYLDIAYMLLTRKEYPSWLYPVTMGATTIWERWGAIKPDGSYYNPHMNSFNHYAYGAVGDWMYRTVGGIAPEEPGFKVVRIAPLPGGGLDWVRTSLDGPYGPIAVEWCKDGARLTLDVTIPPNSAAIIELPGAKAGQASVNGGALEASSFVEGLVVEADKARFRVPAGTFSFEVAG